VKGVGLHQLNAPSGVALYDGDVYVADRGNNRIVRWAEDGTAGTLVAEVHSPLSLAVDGNGTVFVVDGQRSLLECRPTDFPCELGGVTLGRTDRSEMLDRFAQNFTQSMTTTTTTTEDGSTWHDLGEGTPQGCTERLDRELDQETLYFRTRSLADCEAACKGTPGCDTISFIEEQFCYMRDCSGMGWQTIELTPRQGSHGRRFESYVLVPTPAPTPAPTPLPTREPTPQPTPQQVPR
jgi:hypothetical protein